MHPSAFHGTVSLLIRVNHFFKESSVWSFLKMPAIRRANLSHRTRNATGERCMRVSQTDDQRETRHKVERNRWDRNRQQKNVLFNPYRAAFN